MPSKIFTVLHSRLSESQQKLILQIGLQFDSTVRNLISRGIDSEYTGNEEGGML